MTHEAPGTPDMPKTNGVSPEIARKLAASAEHSEQAIAVGNRAGVVEWANSAWERVTGYALDRFVEKPVSEFLHHIDIESDVVELVAASFMRKKVCEVDVPIETPTGARIWIHLRVEPLLDAAGDITDFVAVASDVTNQKRAEIGDAVTIVDLSELAVKGASRHEDLLHEMTDFDFTLDDDLPMVLADHSLLESLVGRLICRAAESTKGGWGTISISTGILGEPGASDGPLYTGNLWSTLPHGQFAYLEVHDTGSAPLTGRHQQIEEPFLSSHYPEDSMRLSTACLLLHNQGGEILLESCGGHGTSVVLLLPYCIEHGLERG